MNNIDPNAVYISFKVKDTEIVKMFSDLLRKNNIQPRSCAEKDNVRKISTFIEEIGNARYVVIFYNPEYFKSYHCMNEYALIRQNIREQNIFTVRTEKFDFNTIDNDLRRFWGAEMYANQPLTKYVEAAQKHSFYLNEPSDYSIQKLPYFFRDDNYYTPDNLEGLVNQIKQCMDSDMPHSPSSQPISNVDFNLQSNYHRPLNKNFHGRIDFRDSIYDYFFVQNYNLLNIYGIGGIGKTSVAHIYLDEYYTKQKLYDKVLFFTSNNDLESDFCEELKSCLHQSDIDWKNIFIEGKAENKFDYLVDKVLCNISAAQGKKNLLIFDINIPDGRGFENRHFYETIANLCIYNWHVLLLSRLKMVHPYTLNILLPNFENDKDGALGLFKEVYKKRSGGYECKFSSEDLETLFEDVYYHPLLIEQLAVFAVSPSIKPYSALKEAITLDDKRLFVDSQDLNQEGIVLNKKNGTITTIYDYLQHLISFDSFTENPEALFVLKHFVLWPYDWIPINTINQLLVDESHTAASVLKGLNSLVDKVVLSSNDEQQYRMHGALALTLRNEMLPNGIKKIDSFISNTYIKTFCTIICEGNLSSETEKCIKNIDTIYLPWLKRQAHPDLSSEQTDKDGFTYVNIPVENYGDIKMMKVRGGSYMMGCDSDSHKVTLDDFYIAETQVTQKLWLTIMKDTKLYMTSRYNPCQFKKGGQYPVENVTWYECIVFIMKLNEKTGMCFRLPTEAEWEYAARSGGKAFLFSWNTWAQTRSYGKKKPYRRLSNLFAWFDENSDHKTHPVATDVFPNDLGIYDMSGNVYEWCQDWYEHWYSWNKDNIDKSNNPQGPISGEFRVCRGGAFNCDVRFCKVDNRKFSEPGDCRYNIGFRLLLSSQKNDEE